MRILVLLCAVSLAGCSCSKSHEADASVDAGGDALDAGDVGTDAQDANADVDTADTLIDTLPDVGDAPTACLEGLWDLSWEFGAELAYPQDGRVVLTVGTEVIIPGSGLAGGENLQIFDTVAEEWARIQLEQSVNNTGTLLPSGEILIAGAASRRARDQPWRLTSDRAQLYNPSERALRDTTPMNVSRGFHRAVFLDDGRVMVAGGWHSERVGTEFVGDPTETAEAYDEDAETWTPLASMSVGRWSLSLTKLLDGRVLAAGGFRQGAVRLSSAEVYDPDANEWHAVGRMSTGRAWHEAQLLPSGRVLVVGGENEAGDVVSSAELFDPVTETWSAAASLPEAAEDMASLALPSGRVLVAGGFGRSATSTMASIGQVNLYDETGDCWQALPPLQVPRWHFGLARLPDGRVMAVPGWTDEGPTATCEITSIPLD